MLEPPGSVKEMSFFLGDISTAGVGSIKYFSARILAKNKMFSS